MDFVPLGYTAYISSAQMELYTLERSNILFSFIFKKI